MRMKYYNKVNENTNVDSREAEREKIKMKEFKYCHEEITEGVEIPVTVCETQKEMVAELVMQYDCFKFVAERLNAVEEERMKGYYNLSGGTLNQPAYTGAMDWAISGTDEEMMYIIYKDGSEYWNGADEVKGKFQRYGIKRAIISTPWGYTVFGDFAINDMGDVTIEESEIEEYGVYAGQYDVKEQDEQETVEQTTEIETSETIVEAETEETVEQAAEQETVEGISKMETTTETDDSGFEYYSVKVAYEVIKDEIRSALFTSYSLALKVAEDFTDMWDGDKAIVTAVNFIIRNDRQPTNERDKKVLETETAEIERRRVPYHDWGLSGYVSIEDRQVVNA